MCTKNVWNKSVVMLLIKRDEINLSVDLCCAYSWNKQNETIPSLSILVNLFIY
jgi:hypothetical protein